MSLLSKWKHNLQARGKSLDTLPWHGLLPLLRHGPEWPWRAQTGTKVEVGWGKRHRCPLIQPTCSCPTLGRGPTGSCALRVYRNSVCLGYLPPSPPPAVNGLGCPQKAILVRCWKACVLSSASLHRYKQGQAVWFTGKSTLEGLRGPGPAMLHCGHV